MNTPRKILAAGLLLVACGAWAQPYPETSYTLSGSELIAWTGPETEVDFTADPVLKEKVKAIASNAFADNEHIKVVKLSSSLGAIRNSAFNRCSALEAVTFSNSGAGSKLTIEGGAFVQCPNLATVALSEYVVSIDLSPFTECPSLTQVTVPSGHPFWKNDGAAILTKGGDKIVLFPPGVTGHYDVPEGVTTIADFAFYGCSLTSVYMPDGVATIGEEAFCRAEKLARVAFPNTLRAIESHAFERCSSLKTLVLPPALETLGGGAFRHCTSLPDKVTLPASLSEIVGTTFAQSSVKQFEVAAGNLYYSAIDGVLTNFYQDEIVAWPSGREVAHYAVPEGIYTIGQGAFYGSSLQDVTFPASLLSVGRQAFLYSALERAILPEGVHTVDAFSFNSDSLREIELPATLTELHRQAFSKPQPDKAYPRRVTAHMASPVGTWLAQDVQADTLYVPEASLDLYAIAPGWREFAEIRPIQEAPTFVVTFDEPENGILVVSADGHEIDSGTSVEEGALLTVVVIPYPGYRLESITANGAPIANNGSFTATEAVYIAAIIVPDTPEEDPGDLNGDGQTDVADVTTLVSRVLAGQRGAENDLNGDGQVDVADVTTLVDVVLSE